MGRDLESPFEDGNAQWASLYRARGDEVSATRPIFTGDVYAGLELAGATGEIKYRSVCVIQHPCAMRTDGVTLIHQLLVAEVVQRSALTESQWSHGFFNLLPLPDLRPEIGGRKRHQAVDFNRLHLVRPQTLPASQRIASLSQRGVNLLLQRWVHFSSRVVVETHHFQSQTEPQFEEADLIEDWCDESDSGDTDEAARECVAWLRADRDGSTYQAMLEDPQQRSAVRKAARVELRARRITGV